MVTDTPDASDPAFPAATRVDQQDLPPHRDGNTPLRVGRRRLLGGALGLGLSGAAVWGVRHLHHGEEDEASGSEATETVPTVGLGAYQRRVFADGFDSPGSVGLEGPEVVWFRKLPFGWGTSSASEVTVTNSIARITPNQDRANYTIATMSPDGKGTAFGPGLFEARMRFPAHHATGQDAAWPAFWSLSSNHITNPTSTSWVELDFFEAMSSYQPPRFYGTIHDWSASGYHVQSQPNHTQVATDFSHWNTYGCLWETDRVTWLLNRQPVMHQTFGSTLLPSPRPDGASVGTFSRLSNRSTRMALILGTGVDWPLEVDWVAVWQ